MASIQGIYVALFGRPADPAGLSYFNVQTQNGADLTAIGDLTGTAEYGERFASLTDKQVITSIFESLFERNPDPAGLQFFLDGLADGSMTINSIAIDILNGAQNEDLATVNAKIAAADIFTISVNTPDEVAAYQGNDAAAVGRAFIADVESNDPGTQVEADAAIASLFGPDEGQVPGEGQTPGGGTGGGGGGTVIVEVPTDVSFRNSNGSLAASGLAPNGSQQSGAGNFNTGFTVVETRGSGENDIQTGFNGHLRQASITDSYFEAENGVNADGKFEIFVINGSQLAANGSQSDNLARAQTAQDVLINVDAFGGTGKTFADYDVRLLIDVDPTVGETFATFEMSHADPLLNGFLGTNGYAGGFSDGATNPALNGDSVYSDSLNFGFIDIDPNTAGIQVINFNTLGDHTVRLEIYERGTNNLVHEHETLYHFVGQGSPQIDYV